MTKQANPSAVVTKRSRPLRIVCAAGGASILLVLLLFFGVGRWLVVEDPLEKAQSIVVLSGRMPMRAFEAARLYRQAYAPEIWLTHSVEPGKTLEAMGISFAGEDYYNTRVLLRQGVPPEAIRILEPPIVNTADEIRVIAAALGHEKNHTVILVTTKAHTRRVRVLWRRLGSAGGRGIVRAASDDPFDPGRWWRNTADALEVVREVLGLLNAWAGLPLHPAPLAVAARCLQGREF